jgi:hypothetical protein
MEDSPEIEDGTHDGIFLKLVRLVGSHGEIGAVECFP